jgi:DNA sulfur modification protein DndC
MLYLPGFEELSTQDAALPRRRLTPQCFQGRRLVRHGGQWFVFPNEEPRPGGEGKGRIAVGMGLEGFADPRILWQSTIPKANGEERKPVVLRPVKAYDAQGKPRPEADQRGDAGPQAIVAGTGPARRYYARPTISRGGERVPDRGRVVRQLEGGAVWWQSEQRTKDGRLPAPRTIEPLTDEQVEAIEVELGLAAQYPDPLERFLYLVREHDALVIVNHSGGKDSQAMYLHLTRDLGVPHAQIRVVHADLPGADWPGTLDHVKRTTDGDVAVVSAKFRGGMLKELYDYVRKRKKFPSAAQRYCTSDLKTSPINAWIREAMCRLNGLPRECRIPPEGRRIIVSTLGMRAQESDNRAGLAPWELNVGESVAGRLWFEYLPIHEWPTTRVFDTIRRHGQEPFWIYGQTPAHRARLVEAGSVDDQGRPVPMQRMSCVFCIMASTRDIGVASLIGPKEIAEEICKVEGETGHTFRYGTTFRELQAKGIEAVRGKARKVLDVLRTARERKGPCK